VELREKMSEAELGLSLEGQQDLAIEGRDGEVRVGEIDDAIDVAVEGVSEGAQGGGFAGTDVTGDEGREALLEGEGEAALDLLMAAGRVKVLGGDGFGEGGLTEAVEVIESDHWTCSPLSWMD
jgi:hypothetical protein